MSGEGLRASGVLLILVGAVLAVIPSNNPDARTQLILIDLGFFALGVLVLGLGMRKRPFAVPGRVTEGWSRRNATIGAVGAVLASLTMWALHELPAWLPVPDAVLLFGLLGAPLSMFVLVAYEQRCVRCRLTLTRATQASDASPAVWFCSGCRRVAITRAGHEQRTHLDDTATQVIARARQARPQSRAPGR